MHENVTTAQMVALSCVRPSGARKRIVCSAMDFPSMIYLYRAQQAAGFELRIVPAESDLTVSTERMLDAIDDTTAVVAFSHVLFRTSYIMDADAIARRARQVGATTILDTYQSAGIIPVDVEALGVDFAVGGCLKWLCGGPGNAFLYTRPDLLKRCDAVVHRLAVARASVRLRFEGSDLDSLVFDRSSTDVTETRESRSDPRRDDAMRMMNGTPSIPAYYAALAGLDIINAVGVERIREASTRDDRAAARAGRRYGFTSAASRDPERLAGTVAVDVPDALLVSRTLKARDFIVDYRPPVGIRISPHFYNTMDEIDRVMAEIASIAAAKDYADGGTSSLVT